MKAIVYTTQTGSTKRYAAWLAAQTGLPLWSLAEAGKRLPAGTEILYLGWVRANCVMGYTAAAKRFAVRAVCAVGMCKTGTNTEPVRTKTRIPKEVALFSLQGNLTVEKLPGIYRLLMKGMRKALAGKKERTPEESKMLEQMYGKEDLVKAENLEGVLTWYETEGENG